MVTPQDINVTGGGPQPQWVARNRDGLHAIPAEFAGLWLTFYSYPAGQPFAELPPDMPVATASDGTVLTAGAMAQTRATLQETVPLHWDNESVLQWGHPLGEAAPDTCLEWVHVIYTAWQLMAQTGSRQIAELDDVQPPRDARRRAERAGTTAPSVRVVRVHTRHRPKPAAADEDSTASTGRRAPQWTCRWPVAPYRRNTCMNPRQHADGGCEHEEHIVPAQIRGPKDKPLRVRDTVHVWDQMPE